MLRIPFINEIYDKLGKTSFYIYHKEKEDRYFFYRSIGSEASTQSFLSYDVLQMKFSFNGDKYSVPEFYKVLKLLAFL
jgi:hypothetical protein